MDNLDKPVLWVGSSRSDLREFPREVRRVLGHNLRQAQQGRHPHRAKVLKGFKSAGVVELVASRLGSTYRVVYTVRFANAVYVLHAFEKKAKRGIKTPPQEIELVRQRLRMAEQDHAKRQATKNGQGPQSAD